MRTRFGGGEFLASNADLNGGIGSRSFYRDDTQCTAWLKLAAGETRADAVRITQVGLAGGIGFMHINEVEKNPRFKLEGGFDNCAGGFTGGGGDSAAGETWREDLWIV